PPAPFELHLVPWWVLMVPGGWLPCLQSVARSLLSSLVCRESSEVGQRAGSGFGEGQRHRSIPRLLRCPCRLSQRRVSAVQTRARSERRLSTAPGLLSPAAPV